MFKIKPIKALLSVLATISLAFGSAIVVGSAADASPSLSTCANNNWNGSGCGGSGSALTNINATVGSAITSTSAPTTTGNCISPTFALYLATESSFTTSITTLPSGLAFASSGVFSGTPTAAQSVTSYLVVASCSSGSNNFEHFTIDVAVSGASSPAITPATQTLSATVNTAITATTAFSPSNFAGSGAYTYSVSPTLPAGLSLDTTTGVISGTPTAESAAATYTITAARGGDSATATISITVSAAGATASRKVTICHRTHSVTNPYVRITVDYNSVNKDKGHKIHDEIFGADHVYNSAIKYRAKDKLWGDIIPADSSGQNRWSAMNWTTLGEKIYNGDVAGCPSKFDAKAYYNALREEGMPAKQIKAELKALEDEQAEADNTYQKNDVDGLTYSGTNANLVSADADKVTICHRTNSTTNPYRKITVSAASIMKKKGHYSHDDIYKTYHVFDSTVSYPANQKDWGDIIPADPTGKNRWAALNWTTLGQQIYSGAVKGCAEQTTQEYYNALRESGEKKKDIKKDLEEQGNVDDDSKDIDGIQYNGTDPNVEKTEPKPPVEPAGKTIPDQSLSGIVWLDLNKDGLKDPDEPLMKDIVLSVVKVSTPALAPASKKPTISTAIARPGAFVATAAMDVKPAASTATVVTVKTDKDGFYIFPSLGAGDWKVVTGIPADLSVTYDSQGSAEGEIVATVPVSSHAFTWVGLVGATDAVSQQLLFDIVQANPDALPKDEWPTWLKTAVARGTLAYTGTRELPWLFFGLLLIVAGAGTAVFAYRRK